MYYFCDCCHYCFQAEQAPERCPDCGKKMKMDNKAAVRKATSREIEELLRIRREMEQEEKRSHMELPPSE